MLHTVASYLRNSAEMYPAHPVMIDKKRSLNYGEALDEAERIAFSLISDQRRKKPIAILMEKCADAIVAFFGVALSGNFYTVIDDKMPQNRKMLILDSFDPEVIIADKKNENKARELGREVWIFEEIIAHELSDSDKRDIRSVESGVIDTDLLYVLYTSGSTGVPKGVAITHRSVIDYTEWVSEAFNLDHDMIIGNQAPFFFDNSVLDIYSTVRNGGTMHIIPQTLYSFPIRLLEYIRDNHINTVFWVPTVLSRIADMDVLDKCDISCLRRVLFAGEVMPARQLNVWRRRLPEATFANLYGPTEITVDCTCYIVDREIRDNESVPIGYACENSDVLVLNEKNEPVSVNEKGELCVRGSSLSPGYYGDMDRTSESFVQNPLQKHYREWIYRTGDIVHYNERGELIYDGRMDSQVKHAGHRIELGEIETVASSDERIRQCCCLHDKDSDKLVLFYSGEAEDRDIRRFLSERLPDYMIPGDYVKMNALPLTPNGKTDRIALGKRSVLE